MTLSTYERGTTWKSQIVFTSGSAATPVNTSGNIATLTIYNPLGAIHYGPKNGIHSATGTYYQRPSTNSTHNLGIYVEEWNAVFNYPGEGWKPKYDRKAILIEHVIQ